MTLFEVLKQVQWNEVKEHLYFDVSYSNDTEKAYHSVFQKLQQLSPELSNMRIILKETFREKIDEKPFVEVFGKDGTLNKEQKDFKYVKGSTDSDYGNKETEFALSLMPWKKWLGMELDQKTMDNFAYPKIVACCLYEMTVHGFYESAIRKTKNDLDKRVKELDSMTEQEREEKLSSWNEVKKRLKEKYLNDD